jgi:hypothetical protein
MIIFVLFVVRTMGCKKDANDESMLHREKPLLNVSSEHHS